jgi:transposase
MGKTRRLSLGSQELKSLQYMSLHDSSPSARQRCTIVLLNSRGMTNVLIQSKLRCSSTTITNSLDRYEYEYPLKGLACMLNRGGQGRKAVLTAADTELVRKAVEEERQKLSLAKLIIEENKGIQLSDYQLKTFLKSLVANTNG